MTVDSVATLVDLLGEARLVEPAQLEKLTRDSQFTDPRVLARELVRRGWLTAFQVNQLFQGRGRELVLGPYILLERLGQGGMGQVFKARHQIMNRVVALKIIRKERLAHADAVKRFHREIQAAARLHHPNIVIAYDAAQANGIHFFAMEFVDGTDLAKLLKERGPLPVTEACDYIRQTALGLQHAHERGMVHRDIKPQNLIVTHLAPGSARGPGAEINPPAEPGAKGVLKILDMGLARLEQPMEEDPASALTHEGSMMGTPDYVAPEQANDPHLADIRADLYSLGCTFYHLLTGRVPFPGGTLSQKLLRHQNAEPMPIDRLRADVPVPVIAVVRKMMAKRPEDRYQTPKELAAALETCLRQTTSLPATAPPAKMVSTPVAELAAPMVTTVQEVAAVAATLAQPVKLAPAPGTESPSLLRKWRWPLIGAGAGSLAALVGIVVLVAIFSDNNEPSGNPGNSPGQGSHKPPLEGLGELRRFEGHTDWIKSVAFSPDGKRAVTAGDDNTLRLWDVQTGEEIRRFDGHTNDIWSVAYSPDNRQVLSGSLDGTVRLWEVEIGKELHRTSGAIDEVYAVVFSPDGRRALIGRGDGTVRYWDIDNWQELAKLDGHEGPVTSVAISADGKRAVSGSTDRTVRLWDLEAGREIGWFAGHTGWVTSVALSRDGRRVLSGSADGTARVWAAQSWREKRTREVQEAGPDGKPVTKQVDVYVDFQAGRELARFDMLSVPVASVAFSPDGKRALSSGEDRTIHLWDVETGKELSHFDGHADWVLSVAFSPDGRFALSGSNDRTARVWGLPKE